MESVTDWDADCEWDCPVLWVWVKLFAIPSVVESLTDWEWETPWLWLCETPWDMVSEPPKD